MSKPFEYAAGNRERAWQIIRVALDAVEPGAAVRRHLHLVANHLTIMDPQGGEYAHALDEFDRVLVVGGGKAGAPMAAAVADILGKRLSDGVVIVKHGHTLADSATTSPIKILEAGHPVPDQPLAAQAGAHGTTANGATSAGSSCGWRKGPTPGGQSHRACQRCCGYGF